MSLTAAEQIDGLTKAAEFFKIDVPEVVAPEDRHVVAGDMRIHTLDWGRAGKQPLLFMHGNGLTAHTWDLSILNIRADYHCHAADLRGHGDSEWSRSMQYGIDHHARDIKGIASGLGIDKDKYVLVGMSMGGLASIVHAGAHADELAALVIVDSGPGMFRPRQNTGVGRIRNFQQQSNEHDSIEGFVQQALAFNPRRDPDLLRVSLRHNLMELPDGKWTWKYDRRHHERPGRPTFNVIEAMQEATPKINCPTLVIRGADSDVLDVEGAKSFAEALPNGRWVEVPNAGHTVQGDNPSGFASALRSFLGDIGL